MIYLIFKSYLSLFSEIAAGAAFILFAGFYFIFKKAKPRIDEEFSAIHFNTEEVATKSQIFVEDTPNLIENLSPSIPNVEAIAGDDQLATQLDLARAYIELGSRQLAKKILDDIVVKGNALQQNEARILLGLI